MQNAGRGITNDLKRLNIKNIVNNAEFCKKVLLNYERALSSIQAMKKETEKSEKQRQHKKEAICIANIIKIHSILGSLTQKYKILLSYAERCKYLIDDIGFNKKEEWHIDEKEEWYIEFKNLYKVLKEKESKEVKEENYNDMLSKVKKNNENIFNEIENNFKENKGKIEFIEFILDNHPYKDYKKIDRDFKTYNQDLLKFLIEKYQPDNYTHSTEEEKLEYCIVHEISKKLSYLFIHF